MRIIGENHADLMRRYPGLYQTIDKPVTPKPAKDSFSKKWDKFMVRHASSFSKVGVEAAIERLGGDAPVHFYGGKINRVSLAPGDIFIQYNSSRKHNPHKLPQLLTGNFNFANFTHGGIIVSATEVIHAGVPGDDDVKEVPLRRHTIDEIFNAKREYHIFRPRDRSLASKMVEIATDLCDTKYIPFAGLMLPDKEVLKKGPKGVVKFLKDARACKGDMALFRLSRKARQLKSCEKLREEYDQMLGIDQNAVKAYIVQLKADVLAELNAQGMRWAYMSYTERENVIAYMRAHLETFKVVNYASKKRFICTQFVAWVVQLSSVVLHEMNPDRFPFDLKDILPIRDTKAIPARLAKLLTESQHFVEFRSEESYGVPVKDPIPVLGVALGLVGDIGDTDFTPPPSPTPSDSSIDDVFEIAVPPGLQAPMIPLAPVQSLLDTDVPAGLATPLTPMGHFANPIKRQAPSAPAFFSPPVSKRPAPAPPFSSAAKRQAPAPPPPAATPPATQGGRHPFMRKRFR